jgi:hypothetical protein
MSSFFPWGLQPSTSPVPVNFDLILNKAFPRIGFTPTESGGVYQEIIEVYGTLWTVSNATWDDNLLGWYQSGTCNPALPAYAWSNALDGNATRLYAPAATASNIALTWTATFETDPTTTIVEPQDLANSGTAAFTVDATFNATTGATLAAMQVVVDDLVSGASSSLYSAVVNGVQVWSVDKTGTLVKGSVPSSQLDPPPYFALSAGTGIATIADPPSAVIGLAHGDYVDFATPNQIITAQKNFSNFTPIQFGPGGLGYLNGTTNGDMFWSSGSLVQATGPLTAIAKDNKSVIVRVSESDPTAVYWLYVDTGLTPTNTFNPTAVLTIAPNGNINIVNDVAIGGNTSVGGTLGISGKTTTGDLEVDGGFVLEEPALKDLANNILEPLNGMVIKYDATNNQVEVDGKNFALNVESTDGSVSVTQSGTENQVYDLSVVSSGSTSVTQAIGVELQGPDVNGGHTLSLPNHLPGGSTASWFVTCTCHGFGLPQNSSAYINMTGPTTGNTDGIGGTQNTRTMYTFANMAGGSTPSVTVKGVGVTTNGGADGSQASSAIALTILAIRTA